MIAAVTYSTTDYEAKRKRNVNSAYRRGKADIVFEYSPGDIDDGFRQKYNTILSYKRGAGLWLWKPYVIHKALSQLNEDEYLIYSDADYVYINRIQLLINDLQKSGQDIMVFELPLVSKQWTKRETFIALGYDNDELYETNQILAYFILLKKCHSSVSFIRDYLDACCNEVALSYKQFDETIKNPKEFVAHREDQSILSIISRKYKLTPFRNPATFGKRPWEYIKSKDTIYRPKSYDNSIYPTIFVPQRDNGVRGNIRELKENCLSTFPFYVKWKINQKKMQ